MKAAGEIFTIGHSNLSYEAFLSLLRQAGVTAIADVRTSPFSRRSPQFSQPQLKSELPLDGVAYSFLGKELGGRPAGKQFYCEGVANYERMAQSSDFKRGIQRVLEGAQKYRIALMCSEHDPLDCHRCLLVGRALSERDLAVRHILSNGKIVDQRDIEEKLLRLEGKQDEDLFVPREDRLAAAYRERSRKVAYSEPPSDTSDHIAAE
ncbi:MULTISPECIES: DUF488 domain-containing protein [unclassified Mesorhizobium]|uniref:DUF488 domain-containing protein n=1 Tax=unclassified Mesorhizobium TaxID=325217 RepID=UPI000BAFF561|nr:MULTISPECIES: DUF488 domain-containing protein [unclassified Mesorhizobium]PBC19715.1 hypothetical protein CK226_27995 [Mesorhizobium sp. WSM4311]TRD02112.1 DUF488 domain-containing protein [Mesorhizobium sp. WSM4305]